jgi:hypothetical protein
MSPISTCPNQFPLPDFSLILPWRIQIAIIQTLWILLIGAAVVKEKSKKEEYPLPLPGAVPEPTQPK